MNKELIKQLREHLDLSEDLVSDEDLLKDTEGKLFRARIELHIALSNLLKVIKNTLKF